VSSVTFQAFAKFFCMHYDELTSKLVSDETSNAFTNIAQIIRESGDHGVVDIFKLYSKREVLSSMIALSRLQKVCINSSDTEYCINSSGTKRTGQQYKNLSFTPSPTKAQLDDRLLSELAHYSAYANAAYGWKGGLALSGKFYLGDLQTLIDKTGVKKNDVIDYDWTAVTHRPAYYIVRDTERKNIVLCIRGTWSPKDVLTDLCATAEDFLHNESKQDIGSFILFLKNAFHLRSPVRAHKGMLASARSVAKITRKVIANELASDPNYRLVIVGHSLGAGTAAVLGSIWLDTFPGLVVYAYGCPCVGPADASPTADNAIISVIDVDDPFSTLSIGHIADLSIAISKFCENKDLREETLFRCKRDLCQLSEDDIQWCHSVMKILEKIMVNEKFYPAGRIFLMGGGRDKGTVTLEEVDINKFRHIVLHPYMFDLSKHIPNRYENELKKFWRDYSS